MKVGRFLLITRSCSTLNWADSGRCDAAVGRTIVPRTHFVGARFFCGRCESEQMSDSGVNVPETKRAGLKEAGKEKGVARGE